MRRRMAYPKNLMCSMLTFSHPSVAVAAAVAAGAFDFRLLPVHNRDSLLRLQLTDTNQGFRFPISSDAFHT